MVSPFILFSLPTATTAAQQLWWTRNWVSKHMNAALELGSLATTPRPERARARLRLGYLSADFRIHPVAQLIAELFEKHDRESL